MESSSPMEGTLFESFATRESHAYENSSHSRKRLLDNSYTNAEGREVSPWGTPSSELRRAKLSRLGPRSNGGNFAQAAIPFGSPRSLIRENIKTSRIRTFSAVAQPSLGSRREIINRFQKVLGRTPRVDPPPAGIGDGHKRASYAALRGLSILRTKARNALEKEASALEGWSPLAAQRLRRGASGIESLNKEADEAARRALREKSLKRHEALIFEELRRREAMRRAAEEARVMKAEEARLREAEARARTREAEAAAALAKNRAKSGTKGRVPLTPQQQQQVLGAWTADGDDEAVVVKAFNDTISKKSLMTLGNGLWLGDEVVNLYMKILLERNREAIALGRPIPKCGIMNSFFFTMLSDDGKGYRYQGVRRFLKRAKIDLFALDKLIFPVNVNQTHWTLGVINFRRQRLEYYDSLASRGFESLNGFEYMVRFVNDESMTKRGGRRMDISHWPRVNIAQSPVQQNGFDCGVFTCMFADRLSKGIPLNFSQSDIKHCREVMTLAILRGEGSPSEEEALVEDWGSPPEGFAWWTGDSDNDKGSAGEGWKGKDDDDYEPWYGGGQLGPEPRANGF